MYRQERRYLMATAYFVGENMAIFVGVSKKPGLLLKIRPGEESYWCVYGGTQPAQPGDLLLLYFTVASSRLWQGIAQLYRVASKPARDEYSECSSHRMAHIKTELLLNLPKPVTIKELKGHPTLRRMNAVNRNMQGVTFVVEDRLWTDLQELIVANNPEAAGVLQSFENVPHG